MKNNEYVESIQASHGQNISQPTDISAINLNNSIRLTTISYIDFSSVSDSTKTEVETLIENQILLYEENDVKFSELGITNISHIHKEGSYIVLTDIPNMNLTDPPEEEPGFDEPGFDEPGFDEPDQETDEEPGFDEPDQETDEEPGFDEPDQEPDEEPGFDEQIKNQDLMNQMKNQDLMNQIKNQMKNQV